MTEITVLERENGALAKEISRKFHAAAQPVLINCALSTSELCGTCPELLVVAPDFAVSESHALPRVKCGILLLAGGANAAIFDTSCIVTYGMSPKNTLTVSSISGARLVISLQREVATVEGVVLERQELVVEGHGSAECRLAAAGAVLLSGLLRGE